MRNCFQMEGMGVEGGGRVCEGCGLDWSFLQLSLLGSPGVGGELQSPGCFQCELQFLAPQSCFPVEAPTGGVVTNVQKEGARQAGPSSIPSEAARS